MNKCKKEDCYKETNTVFCSKSCAASYNNRGVIRNQRNVKKALCLNCGKEFEFNPNQKTGKYCSHECWANGTFEKTLVDFNEGKINSPNTVKKCFAHDHRKICYECGNKGEYNGKPLVLQIDHIDGNSDNNFPENLRWLCPNCHSQTPTYGRKGRTLKETKREEYRRKNYRMKS